MQNILILICSAIALANASVISRGTAVSQQANNFTICSPLCFGGDNGFTEAICQACCVNFASGGQNKFTTGVCGESSDGGQLVLLLPLLPVDLSFTYGLT